VSVVPPATFGKLPRTDLNVMWGGKTNLNTDVVVFRENLVFDRKMSLQARGSCFRSGKLETQGGWKSAPKERKKEMAIAENANSTGRLGTDHLLL